MNDTPAPRQPAVDQPPRWEPADPALATLFGIALVFVGGWMLFGGGPVPAAWGCLAVGAALLGTGVVASGVAWGMALHSMRRR